MPDERASLHIIVSGKVQGVFFRYATRSVGEELGLDGWVRNLYDGRVEIMAEGERDKLERLLEFAHRGPPAARVDEVRYEWGDAKGGFGKGFKVVTTSTKPLKDL
ncbi:MAG TPA: acylphosphatase [Candidatus Syntrophoarchaeum butanivorans]|uniref:Acylphosphatase n=1 Tax=Candidatus Syntropharchaeum butanivorans TaxID=1839936 RepID=A0A7C1B948_9EURY|nr:MAG: acylphosphatase [Candidatus Syntrophoarchaeum sp. WYZ-LMO15]HDM36361.1 acylphosphatase [Candidatus Syntrophoarchaeum butanivorans]HEC57063.1 acylphosphatase [Candidatus Syntrophoarchaeum butanivorans]